MFCERMSASLDGIIWLVWGMLKSMHAKGIRTMLMSWTRKQLRWVFFTLRFSTFGEQDEDNDVRE